MSLSLQSLVFNLTACAAIGDLSSCSVACAEHASGDATAVCAAEGGTFAFEGCRAHCLALPRYHPSTSLRRNRGRCYKYLALPTGALSGDLFT